MDCFVQHEMLQKMLKDIKNNFLLFIHMSQQEFPL